MKYLISFFIIILAFTCSCTANDTFDDKYNQALAEHDADLPWSNEVSKEWIPYLTERLKTASSRIDTIYIISMLGHILTKNNSDITKKEENDVIELIKEIPKSHLRFNESNSIEIIILKSFKGNSAFKIMAENLKKTKDTHLNNAIFDYLKSLSN